MLRLPNCDFCMNYLQDEEKDCCLAFPEGIPLEVMVKAEPGVECAPGYTFIKKESVRIYEEPSKDGLYSRLLDKIGE